MIDVAAKLEEQADILFDNLTGWEISTLQRIGNRIRKIGKMTPAELKQINNIASVKRDMDAITKDLAKITGLNIKQVKQIYSDALESKHLENKPLYDFRSKDFSPLTDNMPLQAIVSSYSKITAETMINLAKTKALGVIDGNGKFINLQKAYTDILDRAVMQAASGATDFNTAMREAIKGLGGSGIRIDYGGGITRRLDTSVRQSLLWGAKQASIEYNELIGEELGCDGIEIDWHSNPRPSHEFMQGKQYSLDGKKTVNGKTFEDAAPALSALNDYGCLHFKTPIICGVSVPRYTDKELAELNRKNAKEFTVDGKTQNGYGWTQDMRRLETEARKQKVIRETAKASGDNELVKQCNNKLKAINKKYAQISKETGIKAQPQRMSIVENGDMPQKPLTTTDGGGIISKNKVRVTQTGGVLDNGALNPERAEDFEAAQKHAFMFYEEVRKRKTDVDIIAKNVGWSKSDIELVKNHIFINRYDLGKSDKERFYPHYDIAISWQNLTDGKNITDKDIILLNHELLEYKLMSEKGMNYREAHKIAEKKYNYAKAVEEWRGKYK